MRDLTIGGRTTLPVNVCHTRGTPGGRVFVSYFALGATDVLDADLIYFFMPFVTGVRERSVLRPSQKPRPYRPLRDVHAK